MKYQAVIFDLDGTILSTLDDLAHSVNYALEANGLPQRTYDEIRTFVGNGGRLLVERSVPKGTPLEEVDRVHQTFNTHYKLHSMDKTKAYDGVYAMLDGLKKCKVKLAVLSNKPNFAIPNLMKHYFDGYFDAAYGEVEGIPKKPAPDGVYRVMQELGVQNENCVYVGDSEVDVATAINSKLDCIAVDWGFRSRQTLIDAGAKIIVSTPDELFKAITK